MSELEGTVFASAVLIIWLLVSIRDTLRNCLKALEKLAAK